MTATKVIGESVKQTNRTFIKSYVNDYADAITENYRRYHIRSLKGMLDRNHESDYAKQQLAELENGTAKLYRFVVKTGKRYYKIVQQEFETWERSKYYGQYRDGSVHCFVDKETGDVYKAASWRSPAKHIRFSFQNVEDLKFLLNPDNVGWAGGYLYMR